MCHTCSENSDVPEEIEEQVKISDQAAGIAVPITFTEMEGREKGGSKRERTDPLFLLPSKKPKMEETKEGSSHGESGLEMEVWRQDTCLGVLAIGPLRRHQRCVFGRAPNADVRLEHASISRQHAKIEVDETGHILITDLASGKRCPSDLHAYSKSTRSRNESE